MSHSNSSSRAITSSTLSRESAPRSSTKEDSFLMSASATPSCSATIFLTRALILSIETSSRLVSNGYLRERGTRCGARKKREIIPSIHVHPAVHVQRGAGDVGGLARAE